MVEQALSPIVYCLSTRLAIDAKLYIASNTLGLFHFFLRKTLGQVYIRVAAEAGAASWTIRRTKMTHT